MAPRSTGRPSRGRTLPGTRAHPISSREPGALLTGPGHQSTILMIAILQNEFV